MRWRGEKNADESLDEGAKTIGLGVSDAAETRRKPFCADAHDTLLTEPCHLLSISMHISWSIRFNAITFELWVGLSSIKLYQPLANLEAWASMGPSLRHTDVIDPIGSVLSYSSCVLRGMNMDHESRWMNHSMMHDARPWKAPFR